MSITDDLRERIADLTRAEVAGLECTVSLLTHYEAASSWDDWEVGTHGLIVDFTDPATGAPVVDPTAPVTDPIIAVSAGLPVCDGCSISWALSPDPTNGAVVADSGTTTFSYALLGTVTGEGSEGWSATASIGGRVAGSGPRTMMPEDTQVIVTYDARWNWDFKTYLIELNLEFHTVIPTKKLADAQYYQPSLTPKAPPEAVRELIGRLFRR